MMWGWLKPVLDWLSGFLKAWAETPTKGSDAKTTDETRKNFQEQLGGRIKRPGDPPAH